MTKRRLTILFPSREIGGAERYVQTIAEAALARGWKVVAAFPPAPETDALRREMERDGIVCRDLRIGAAHDAGWRSATAAAVRELGRTWRLLLSTRPHATLVSLPYPDGSPGATLAAAWFPVRSMVMVHLVPDGYRYTRSRRMIYALARMTPQRWLTPSRDCSARLAAALGCDPLDLGQIYHGVPLGPDPQRPDRLAQRDAARHTTGLPHDAVIVLSVARLSHQKGLDVLTAAIPAVAAADPRALWVWAGDGDRRDELVAQLTALDVRNRVRLLGDRRDVPQLLAAADLFVLPTRNEALGLAMLEAMAAGVPVIASDLGALREIAEDGVHARLVAPQDAAALTEAMSWALAHPSEMQTMAAAAYARVNSAFRPDEMIARTLSVLSD